jgi:hypothetical protein
MNFFIENNLNTDSSIIIHNIDTNIDINIDTYIDTNIDTYIDAYLDDNLENNSDIDYINNTGNDHLEDITNLNEFMFANNSDDINGIFPYLSSIDFDTFENFDITKSNLTNINNNDIISDFNYFLYDKINDNFSEKTKSTINHLIDHISNNLYKTSDFIGLQIDLIHTLFIYILKKYKLFASELSNNDELILTYKYDNDLLLSDEIFLKISNSIHWNHLLYTYFLKLILQIDHLELFKYIYEKSLENRYSIDLKEIINFITTCSLYSYNNNNNNIFDYKLNIQGAYKCLRIFKYMLDQIPDKIQCLNIVEEFYKNSIKYHCIYTNTNELFIDKKIEYIVINNNPDETYLCNLIYTYFNYNDIKHLNKLVLESIISSKINSVKIIKNAISFFKDDINNYAIHIYKTFNKDISKLIDYKEIVKSQNSLYMTLLNISTIHIWSFSNYLIHSKWKYLHEFIKIITHNKYINLLSDYQLNSVFFSAFKHCNLIIIKRLFKYYYVNNHQYIKNILKYATNRNIIKMVVNLILKHNNIFDFNNEQMIYIYLKNTTLLCYLLKKNIISPHISNILFNLIINNKIKINNINRVLSYIISKTSILYDDQTSNYLYKKKLYTTLCIYLTKTYNHHKFNYLEIRSKYKNIINTNNFYHLMLKLNITIDNAYDILKLVKCRWYKKKILFLMKNIIKFNIEPINQI